MEEAFQLCDRLLIMHKGQNIMEGSPENLLKENMEPYVLEVRDAETSGGIDPEKLSNRVRADRGPDVMRYYSSQIDLLKDLAASHLKAGNYLIRQTNLEDVFLKATGRQLDDRQ
jgi:lipooligosaccharide transport system ATP-binding protein